MGQRQGSCELRQARRLVRRACLVFSDPFGIGAYNDRDDYGEDRFRRIGTVEGTLVFVSYTERDGRVRIISARRATKHEQDDYYQQNR
jgi:uncharacterized DUF497 family protein